MPAAGSVTLLRRASKCETGDWFGNPSANSDLAEVSLPVAARLAAPIARPTAPSASAGSFHRGCPRSSLHSAQSPGRRQGHARLRLPAPLVPSYLLCVYGMSQGTCSIYRSKEGTCSEALSRRWQPLGFFPS